jgi:hypothetical protein
MATWLDIEAFVPEISDKKIEFLLKKMKPVGKNTANDSCLCYMKECDPRNQAFTWSPEYSEKAEGLIELTSIKTHHYCGYYGFFKPSIAEVLAQIPDEYIDKVVAFETITGEHDGEDEVKILRDGRGHLATTVLYTNVAINNTTNDIGEPKRLIFRVQDFEK